MPFDHDVFISYRHLDNKAPAGEQGWVDDFTERLRVELGYRLGREPDIWRDPTIKGADYFADVIMEHLAGSKILVSILSPGYIDHDSPWCMRELSEFYMSAGRGIGVRVGNTSRCVKVVKTYLSRDAHPTELQGQTGYEFFEEDQDSKRPREFSHKPNGPQHDRYLDRIDQLAWDISELLKAMASAEPPKPPPDPERTVYLAQTTPDRSKDWDSIKTELVSRGFHVLPDEELPETASEYQEAVRENLRRSRLSIHLIGERYGNTLAGEALKSVAYMQNELAAQHSVEEQSFERVIWIPPGLKPNGDYQSKFVHALRTDADAQKGAEVLERSFEELKDRIVEKLTTPKAAAPPSTTPDTDELIRIYLMCDKLDFPEVKAVRDFLFDREYEVILPIRDNDETQVIQYHKDNLLECDASLIYFGHGNEFWLHSKLKDLRKAAGWGRAKQMLCKAIYKAAPEVEYKQDYRIREATLLEPPGYTELSREALEEFIARIESARAGLAQTGSGGSQ
jgi:hypothetical protein